MRIAVFSSKSYDKQSLSEANKKYGYDLVFFEPQLNSITSRLAAEFPAVCVFVNDILNRETLTVLSSQGTRLIALRCAGYNNVDLQASKELGMTVVRVPAYSPHGVAEHAVTLMLALNRRICRAYNRIHDGNFSIEGLLGFELYGKTFGLMGTGKIGVILARIMQGFGCKLLAYDLRVNPECQALGAEYVPLEELYAQSDIISLHLPLMKETHHIINQQTLSQMKSGVMLINTSRGGLIDSSCLIDGLKSGKIGYLGLDVYEEEESIFFQDLSGQVIQDDILARLLSFPNVIITSHQAFFTNTALENIADTTLSNIRSFEQNCLIKENVVK